MVEIKHKVDTVGKKTLEIFRKLKVVDWVLVVASEEYGKMTN